MLFLILKEVESEIIVGVNGLKDKISSIKFTYFNNDIKEMMDHIQDLCEEVLTKMRRMTILCCIRFAL